MDNLMLRDYFAAAALAGLVATGWGPENDTGNRAYALADMMLNVRRAKLAESDKVEVTAALGE